MQPTITNLSQSPATVNTLAEALAVIQDAYLSLTAGRLEEAEGILAAFLVEVEGAAK